MSKSNKNFNPRMTDASDISKPWDKDNRPGGRGTLVLQIMMLKMMKLLMSTPYQKFKYPVMMRLSQN